jgi:hypothetical protein
MMTGEVRILYAGNHSKKLDQIFEEFMESLGYKRWAAGYGYGERELCFLPPEDGLKQFYAERIDKVDTDDE